MNDFKFGQGQMAALLGIPVEEVRTRRKKILREGEDWIRDGNRVWFSEAAVEKMRADLSLPAAQENAEEEQAAYEEQLLNAGPMIDCGTCKAMREEIGAGPASGSPRLPVGSGTATKNRRVFALADAPLHGDQIKELMVYRTVANPRIVEAVRPGTDFAAHVFEFFRVQVRDSSNFTRGMLLPVRLVQAPDFFEFTGRLPRWRGKY